MVRTKLRKLQSCIFNAAIALLISSFSFVVQAAVLSGVIEDKSGQPIEGANALLFQVVSGELVQTGALIQVDATGVYSWTVDDGDYVLRTYFNKSDVDLAGAPNIVTLQTQDFAVVGDTQRDSIFNFVVLSGQVVDNNNIPIANVDMQASQSWSGPEVGPQGFISQTSITHVNQSSVTNANGFYSLLLFSSDTCVDSGFYANNEDCYYDVTFGAPQGSGFGDEVEADVAVTKNQSLNSVLTLVDQTPAKIIIGPYVKNITDTSAVVEWVTDEVTNASVTISGGATFTDPRLLTFHSIVLTGLSADTNYSAAVNSDDAQGNSSETANINFTSALTAESIAPEFIQNPNFSAISHDNFTISFCANEPVTGKIIVDATDYLLGGLSICHELTINNLNSNQSYSVVASITDIAGNGPNNSQMKTITTLAAADSNAPIISSIPVVVSVSDSSAIVLWTTNEPATSGITINDGISWRVVEDDSLVTQHSSQLIGLKPETDYVLRVSSKDAVGNGPTTSQDISFKTKATPDVNAPIMIGRPLIQDISNNDAVISWLTDESSSTVLFVGTQENDLNRLEMSPGFDTQHQISLTNLLPATTYYFATQSEDLTGNISASSVYSFTTKSEIISTSLKIISGPIIERLLDNTVTLSWKTNINSDSRLVCESTNGVTEVNKVDRQKNHILTMTALQPDTRYRCAVYSSDVEGFIANEVIGFVTTNGADETPPQCLAPPSVLSYGTFAELTWQADTFATTSVKFRQSGTSDWSQIANTALTQSGFILLTELIPNTNYEHQVTLSDASGNSANCQLGEFDSGAVLTVPSPVFAIQPFVTQIDQFSAVINWSTERISNGQVRFGISDTNLDNLESDPQYGLSHDVVLNNLLPDTTYYVLVDAFNADSVLTNTTSNIISFTTLPLVAPRITAGPFVKNITDVSAVIEWETDKAANSQVIISGGSTLVDNELTTLHSVLLTGLTADTNYFTMVSSTDENAQSSAALPADFRTLAGPDLSLPTFISGPNIRAVDYNRFTVSFCADRPVSSIITVDTTNHQVNTPNICHEYTVTGLTSNTLYSVVVSITDIAGNGPVTSQPIFVTTLAFIDVEPPVISGPIVRSITDTSAIVQWTTNESANSGVSYTDGSNSYDINNDKLVLTHTIYLTELTPSTTYTLTANSTDALGNGPTISQPVEFTTLGLPDTTAPKIISGPFVEDITTKSAYILWTTDEAASHVVFIGLNENTLNRTITQPGLDTEHSVPVTGLTADTLYYFQVASSDLAGNTVTSAILSFRTLKPEVLPVKLEIIDGPDVESTTTESITISWLTNLNSDSRLVCEVPSAAIGNITYEVSDEAHKKSHILTLLGLEASTNYQCTVYSSDISGDQVSADIRASTTDIADTEAPVCAAAPSADPFVDSAQINWQANELVTGVVKYRVIETSDWSQNGTLTLAQMDSVLLTGLLAETSYEHQVVLTDQVGNSTSCALGNFTTKVPAAIDLPAFSIQPLVINIGDHSATVTWETLEASSANVRYGLSANQMIDNQIDNQFVTSHSVNLQGLDEKTTYYVQVDAFNILGEITSSEIVNFTTTHPNTDFDDDGILNDIDNCPMTANADQLDSDNDGYGNVCDDNDEVLNPPPPQPVGINLRGIVTGEGLPLEDAIVAIYDDEQQFITSVTTPNDGSYLFKYIQAGEYYIGVTPPASSGFPAPPIQPISIADRDVVHLISLIGDALTVSGFLKDSQGRVIDQVDVSLHLQTNGNQVGNSVKTDINGYFEFAVAPGTYQLKPVIDVFNSNYGSNSVLPNYPVPDFAAVFHALQNIEISANTQLDVVMPFALLSGQTLDSSGNPVAGVRLNIRHQFTTSSKDYYLENYATHSDSNALSDASGNFIFAVFTDQPMDILLTPPSSRIDLAVTTISNYSLTSDATEFFNLVDGVSLSGTLRDSQGRPIDNTKVSLHSQNSDQQVGRAVYTDVNGFYQFQVEAGTYKIKPRLNPFGQGVEQRPVYPLPDFATVLFAEENIIVSGNTLQDVVLPLAILDGTVTDGNGNPIADTRVTISHINHLDNGNGNIGYYLESHGRSQVSQAKTDISGQFSLAIFTDQAIDITFIPPTSNRLVAATQITDYVITADNSDTFVLGDALTLSGYLKDDQGNVLDNTMLTAHNQANNQITDAPALTDASGYFEFKVAAGSYKLRPYLQPINTVSGAAISSNYPVPDFAAIYYLPQNITVSADTQLDVVIPMSILLGKTLDANGVAVPGVKLRVDHALAQNSTSYYLQNSGDIAASNALSDQDGLFGFALFTNQVTDISVVPPSQSGFAITNISHNLDQETSEDIFLMHQDLAPKIIYGPVITRISDRSAIVVWRTDKPAKGVITLSNARTINVDRLTTSNSILLWDLEPLTEYSVTVQAVDKDDQTSDSKSTTFTTSGQPYMQAPEFVNGPLVSNITHNQFEISFCADGPVTGIIMVDSTTYNLDTLDICHSLVIDNRDPNTPYNLVVEITDPLGNGPTVSEPQIVTTLPVADTTPPEILLLPFVIDISATEATVIWTTDEEANSGVSYNDGSNFHVVTEDAFVNEHSMQLTDLLPETTYTLVVSSTDSDGNGPTLSQPISFTTLALADIEPPLIIGSLLIQNITHQSVVIRWQTDEPSTTQLVIGLTPQTMDQIESRGDSLTTKHNLAVTGLMPETVYYFQVQSQDAAGNLVSSEVMSFTTKKVGHQGVPHYMTDVSVDEVTSRSITVSWVTDVNATGRLVCTGLVDAIETTLEVSRSKRVKKHQLTLTGLTPANSYSCTSYSTDHKGFTSSQIIESPIETVGLTQTKIDMFWSLLAGNKIESSADGKSVEARAPTTINTPIIKGLGNLATLELSTNELTAIQISYRALGSSAWQQSANLAPKTSHFVVFSGLTENTDYELRYVIANILGESMQSSSINFNSGTAANLATAEFTLQPSASQLTKNTVSLAWSTVDYAFAQVSYGKGSAQLLEKESNAQALKDHRLTLVRLDPATIYYAQVTAYNIAGQVIDSNIISFVTSAEDNVSDSDSDGLADYWEIEHGLDPQDPSDAGLDSDNDGLTNRQEFNNQTDPNNSDSDNDGMPDGWEVDRGLDPNDATDAAEDRDGDGVTNLDEYLNASDTMAPVINFDSEITLNATGILTKIPTANVSATDNIDGEVVVSLVGATHLQSGLHLVDWYAQDAAGNQTLATQIVKINPQVLISKGQVTAEGNELSVVIQLSGEPAQYPVELPFTLSGSVIESDYELNASSLRIEEGTSTQLTVGIVDDGESESDEQLLITLATPTNAVLGSNNQHVITISSSNVAPRVNLHARQNDMPVTHVTWDGGPVTIYVDINDPNVGDQHTLNWSGSDNALISIDPVTHALTFDPASLPIGIYKKTAIVSDDGSPNLSTTGKINLQVVETAPILSSIEDTDGDGIVDADEGYQDSDLDGIADYLDSNNLGNLLPLLVGSDSQNDARYLMQAEAGITLRLGSVALSASEGGALVNNTTFENSDLFEQYGADSYFENVGGLLDFEMSNLAEIGDSALLVIPQTQAIPADAVYRKLDPANGWKDFVLNTNNKLYSALGEAGICPAPGDQSYGEGLTQGHWCLMIEIEDGGANDSDQTANGTIVDPGGISSAIMQSTLVLPSINSVEEGSTINLTGEVTANGNDIVSYLWQQTAGPAASITNEAQLTTTVTNAPAGTLSFSLTITDALGRTTTASVSVVVNAKSTASSGGGGGALGVLILLMGVVGLFKQTQLNKRHGSD